MGGAVQNAFSAKPLQLPGVIVDQEVGVEDTLIAAKDDVRGWDGGEVLFEPIVFGGKRGRNFHRRRGDEDLVTALKAANDPLGLRHDVKDGEKVFRTQIGFEGSVPVG